MIDVERRLHLRRALRELELVSDQLVGRTRYCATCTRTQLVDPSLARAATALHSARVSVVHAATALELDLSRERTPAARSVSRLRSLRPVGAP